MQNVSPEQLARLFHHYHQALAFDFGYAGGAGAEAWDEMPPEEKTRLIAAAELALLELEATAHRKNAVRYFARPGEAEWGY
jgi:hypothetical protein